MQYEAIDIKTLDKISRLNKLNKQLEKENKQLQERIDEIRLDQTKKIFDVIAKLIKENETCTYRYLIYDLLGFEEGAYVPLISGLIITNMLVDYQDDKEKINRAIAYIKAGKTFDNEETANSVEYIQNNLLKILKGEDNENN